MCAERCVSVTNMKSGGQKAKWGRGAQRCTARHKYWRSARPPTDPPAGYNFNQTESGNQKLTAGLPIIYKSTWCPFTFQGICSLAEPESNQNLILLFLFLLPNQPLHVRVNDNVEWFTKTQNTNVWTSLCILTSRFTDKTLLAPNMENAAAECRIFLTGPQSPSLDHTSTS